MHRRVEIVVPPERTAPLVHDIRGLSGLLGLRVQHGISEHPPGDLIAVDSLNESHSTLLELLQRHGIGQDASTSIAINETKAMVSPTAASGLGNERSESGWEQIETLMAKESNMTRNALLVMALSGFFAAAGIMTGALHVVIAGMLVAPGFEPIVRIPLGLVSASGAWRRGLRDLLSGYAALVLGALVAALLLGAPTAPPLEQGTGYMAVQPLVSFWTSVSFSSLLTAVLGGVGGAILIATDRSVLTAGIMVALALVPSAALIGIAVASADWHLAASALTRYATEVVVTMAGSAVFLGWYRAGVQRRRSMLR